MRGRAPHAAWSESSSHGGQVRGAHFLSEVYLADLRLATPQEVPAFHAEHPYVRLEWLADAP